MKAHNNWVAKTRYLVHEIYKYETYIEALRSAIALRVKKQGERKLEKSLRRSMDSYHRRTSEDRGWEGQLEDDISEEFVYESKSGLVGRNIKGLTVGLAGVADEEEDEPITPVAAKINGV
jgi:PH/SEC7 domain-containing protein